jgi:hypothetical protein
MIRVMSRLQLTFPPVVYPAAKARVAEQVAEVGSADDPVYYVLYPVVASLPFREP